MTMKQLCLSAMVMSMANVAAAQEMFDIPGSDIDRRYEIASKHFGPERVQMYSRLEGEDGNVQDHVVRDVNCNTGTIRSLFSGNNAPRSFPMANYDATTEFIEPGSDTEFLARQACASHGFTLTEILR